MNKDTQLTLEQIEALEYKYLVKYWYFLKYVEDDIIKGFESKDDIEADWRGLYGTVEGGISDFAVGCERVIYALLNGKIAGQPNSSPVSSDLFFEVNDAYIHIDLKTVNGRKLTDNIGDYNTSIFIGKNQNSYKGNIIVNKYTTKEEVREYEPHLPVIYHKRNGENKINLTYLVTILSNTISSKTELISIISVPNGKLEEYYHDRPLKAGKNPDKTRFNFKECSTFELLEGQPKRVRVIYQNPNMTENTKKRLSFYLENCIPHISE